MKKKRKRPYRPRERGLKKIGKGLFASYYYGRYGLSEHAERAVDADSPDDGRPMSIRSALAQMVALARLEPKHCAGCTCPDIYVIRAQGDVIERLKYFLDPDWREREQRQAQWRVDVKKRTR